MWRCEAFVGPAGSGHPALVVLDQEPEPRPELPVVVGVGSAPPHALSFRAPGGPLPFCGHGTLVAAWVLAQRLGDGARSLEAGDRAVQTEVEGPSVRLHVPPARVQPVPPPEGLAAALGLDSVLGVVRVNAGSEKWLVEVSPAQLDALDVDNDALADLSAAHGTNGVYVYAEGTPALRARAFNPLANPREDRATGVAALGLAAALGRPLVIDQGPPGGPLLRLRARPVEDGLLLEGDVSGRLTEETP